MSLSVLGKVCLFLCCTGMGICFGNKTSDSRKVMLLSKEFVERLIAKLSFSAKSAEELIENVCKDSDFMKLSYLQAYQKIQKEAFPNRWRKAVIQTQTDDFLQRELLMIGEILGSYDLETQMQELSQIAAALQTEADHRLEGSLQEQKLYPVLGLLAGLFFFILL